ncbi:complement component 1 Q subcomponent-binding protein, mitochondrial-like [Ostrea edulis]|uniref:complement component 1 Q subcomponent-binding protein, mitochondrial-like n=1 Tax=Ostrea edulis TaxID=37623 RepID=UPI002094A3C2|nr:complement component 1 Q subcomponent-binding protein, mitochondrial-like [Ostrea edulis]
MATVSSLLKSINAVGRKCFFFQQNFRFVSMLSSSQVTMAKHSVVAWRKFGSKGPLHQTPVPSEADKAIVNYLKSEIESEMEADIHNVKTYFSDWKIVKAGTEITMTKNFQSEIITVLFNVNDSLEDNYDESEDDKFDGPPMSSRPSFMVEIAKPSGMKMMIECDCIPDQEPLERFDGTRGNDVFVITSVQVYKGERLPKNYVCQEFDSVLYDKLTNVLQERKIDNKFVEELVEFSTDYEHQQYVDFLQKMKSHMSEN